MNSQAGRENHGGACWPRGGGGAAWARLIAGVLLTVLPAAAAFAEAPERAQVAEQLRAVRFRMEQEQGSLKSFKKDQDALRVSLDKLNAEGAKLAKSEEDAKRAVEKADGDFSALHQKVGAAEELIQLQRSHLRNRVVAIYKMHRQTAAVDLLFRAQSVNDLVKRARYVTAIARRDRSALDALHEGVVKLSGEQAALDALRTEKNKRLEEVKRLEDEVAKKKAAKAALLKDLDTKQKLSERSLDKLRRSAESLEKVLESLMGSEEPLPPAPAPEPGSVPLPPPEPEDRGRTSLVLSPFSGAGLAKLRGHLPLPAAGKVVQHYGKQRHEEYSDVLFVKGLEFSSDIGTRVRPVATGRVILDQNLPGFGNVVIVDHGQRYYTLYGRLASVLCHLGDVVGPGTVIGILGEPDHRSRNFYFELRLKGKAIDPEEYFAARLADS